MPTETDPHPHHPLPLPEFARLVRDETGLPLGTTPAEETALLDADFDELPEWDSMYLLKLVTALEQALGHSVPVGHLLEARSLRRIHELVMKP
ncbi:phosphopantetheine-binding protein [Streptomyces sp. NPDC051954]|uniref:phosphopantetheine-binding protein n=1 Tax=unclassified Streptomyces TaxID=2593676 RepID=UPI003449D4D6